MKRANSTTDFRSKWLAVLFQLFVFPSLLVAQIPQVQDKGLLPGDRLLAASFGSQQDHAAAAGGDQQLVVWSDYRSQNSGNSTNQSAGDIFGLRIDAEGNPIDQVPFAICVDFAEQRLPEVAWNGQNWLVVYRSQDPVGEYFANRIRAVRVSPAGVVLDQTPLVIATSDLPFRVAGQNGQWLVTYTEYDANGSSAVAAGRRIGNDGQFLDPQPLVLLDANYGASVLLAANGEYLVAAPHTSDASITRARRIGLNGSPIGYVFNIPSKNVGSRGTEYYVTWVSNFVNLVGSRMSLEGVLLDPDGELLTSEYSQYHYNSVVHDGNQWWIQWGAANIAHTIRVANSGTIIDVNGGPTLPLATTGFAYDPVMVPRSSGGVHFCWWDGRSGDSNVYLLPIDSANQANSERCISTGTATQLIPDFAKSTNGQVAVAFTSDYSVDDRVLVHFLTDTGTAQMPEPIEVARGPNFGKAAIAWNPSGYLVAWDEGEPGQATTRIMARRLRPDGSFIDAAPFNVMTGFSPDVDAVGDDFLIAASRFVTFQTIAAQAKRVDGPTGTILDANPLVLLNGYVSAGPRVSSDGNRWIVTYHSHWSHNSSQSDVVYNFVNQNGTFTPASNPASTSGGSGNLAVAFSGSRYLFVWRSNTLGSANNYISGKIMNANGTFATSDFVIAEAPGRQLRPVVSWNGEEFVVAWDDQRHQQTFFDERTDIYAAHVTSNGVVLDPAGIPVVTNLNGDVTSAIIGTQPGVALVASAQFTTFTPYDSYRIGISAIGLRTLPADLLNVKQLNGSVIAGTIDDLRASDNSYLATRSSYDSRQLSAEMQLWAVSSVDNPGSVDVSIESKVSIPSGVAKISALNWRTNRYDTIDTYAISPTETTRTIRSLKAAKYVNGAGEIGLRIKHTHSGSTQQPFDSFFDLIQIEIGD
jgi:hypothetical protein